jgi:hypothetical protein
MFGVIFIVDINIYLSSSHQLKCIQTLSYGKVKHLYTIATILQMEDYCGTSSNSC